MPVPVRPCGIRALHEADWPAVEAIYAAGIAEGDATFEVATPSWDRWDADHLAEHRFVATVADEVAGWVALSPTSRRPAYAGVVEHSVYVHPDRRRQGVARALVAELIRSTETAGIWTIQSGIFPENAASLRLHAELGFRRIGVRERVGRQDGRWRDVVLIERRSPVVGAG